MYLFHRFFDIFWRSLTDRSYYRDIARSSFRFSLKYLYTLLFLFSFVATLRNTVWFVRKFPELSGNIASFKTTLGTLYPEELVVTLKNGTLSTNVPEPYAIDLPPGSLAPLLISDRKHFIVFDTGSAPDSYKSQETFLLFTKNSVVYPDETGYRVQEFQNDPEELVLNKKTYDAFVSFAQPYVKTVQPGASVLLFFYVLIGPVLGAALALVNKLLYLLFGTFAVLIMARLLGSDNSYKELYHLSMHGLTLPVIATYILAVFGFAVPSLFTVLYLSWMTGVLLFERESGPYGHGNSGS